MRCKLVGLAVVGLVTLGACVLPGGGGVYTKVVPDLEDNDSLGSPQWGGVLLPGAHVVIRGTVAQGDWDYFRFELPPGEHLVRATCTPFFEDPPVVFADVLDTEGNYLGGYACGEELADAQGVTGTFVLNVGLQTSPFRPPVEYEAEIWVDPLD